MDCRRLTLIYFSPTHTTRRILEAIADGVGGSDVTAIDLTPPNSRIRHLPEVVADLALIGAPVYAGRVPQEATVRLQRIRGKGSALIVAVYGNRAFEDALLELRDIALAQGFVPIAGAAFIGEHSYSTAATPIAAGRPDAADRAYAAAFGHAVRDRLTSITSLEELPLLEVPGAYPYRDHRPGPAIAPITLRERCTVCGACEAVCPTGAIHVSHTVVTDERACIRCTACAKVCPTAARIWDQPGILGIAQWLATEHAARREPQVWM